MGKDSEPISRRGLFGLGVRQVRKSVAGAADAMAGAMAVRSSGGRRYLRPPGALPEAGFLLACQRTGACVRACPAKAIRILPPTAGAAAGTPYIDPLQAACHLCLECVQVCTTGAVEPVTDPRRVRMGLAEINPQICWAHQGTPCQVCYDQCPFPDEAIQMAGGVPVISPGACTGCGICACACVSTPGSIRVLPLTGSTPGKPPVTGDRPGGTKEDGAK